MATAERPTKARRTPAPRKSTSAATRNATGTPGAKSAQAASRGPDSAEAERRRQSRKSATVPATKAARRQPRLPRDVASEETATPAAPAARAEPRPGAVALLRRTTMTVPVVNMRVPLLSPRVPDVGAVTAQTKWAAQAVRANLPPVERMVYYGSLGLLASVGALEWPVAAAVGAGVWVAGRTGERHRRQAAST